MTIIVKADDTLPFIDGQMLISIVGISFLGGIIGLDRTAAGQFMISQPLVAAPIISWVLGDLTTGLVIGAVLELIWLLDMPVGTFIPADSTVASIFATSIAVLGANGPVPLSRIGFSILLSVVLAPITIMADHAVRKFNSEFASGKLTAPGTTMRQALARFHIIGLMAFFIKFFLLFLIFIPAGVIAVQVFSRAPDVAQRSMTIFMKIIPLLGVALVVRKLSIKTFDLFLLTGFSIAVILGLATNVPAIVTIMFIVVCGWVGAKYREQRT